VLLAVVLLIVGKPLWAGGTVMVLIALIGIDYMFVAGAEDTGDDQAGARFPTHGSGGGSGSV
jgi:hypothetical protein